MNNFKKLFPFIVPYKKYAYLNIFFNVLYALFSTLSFMALIPMIQVLFDQTKRNTTMPIWEGIVHVKGFLENYLSYFITVSTDKYGVGYTLSIMVFVIISIFLLKNLSDYLAMFFITFLRNGVLRDMRNAMYRKTLDLPLAFFSEKRKGDTISRIAGDDDCFYNNHDVYYKYKTNPFCIYFHSCFRLHHFTNWKAIKKTIYSRPARTGYFFVYH